MSLELLLGRLAMVYLLLGDSALPVISHGFDNTMGDAVVYMRHNAWGVHVDQKTQPEPGTIIRTLTLPPTIAPP